MRKLHNVQCDYLVTASRLIPSSIFQFVDFWEEGSAEKDTTFVTVRRYPFSGGFPAGTWLVCMHSMDMYASTSPHHGIVRLVRQPGSKSVHYYRIDSFAANVYQSNAQMVRILTLNEGDYFELQIRSTTPYYGVTIKQVLFYAIRIG